MKYSCILFAASTFVLTLHSSAFADGKEIISKTKNTADKPKNDSELDQIIVSYTAFAQEMGTQKLDSIDIERLPSKNGTVSDLLKSNPNVRFQEFSDSSLTQGEIEPENVSFHGERFYNNLWLIDGLSNNDNIHPGARNGRRVHKPSGSSDDELPGGGTQSFWINSDIIDSVDVYDSNISAKYGQFTGGVVDAKLKEADTEKISGSVSYRTTRDRWTKFHIYGEDKTKQENNEEDFRKAGTLYNQPQFTKQNYAFNINIPVSDNSAVMFSYSKSTSKIPFFHKYSKTWEEQRRSAETILIKGTHHADNGDTLHLSVMKSPHSSKYFRNNGFNDSYSNNGGGFSTAFNWNHLLDKGTLNTSISYKKSGNEIEHEKNVWQMSRNTSGTIGGYFRYDGGFGTYSTSRSALTLKQELKLDTIKLGAVAHNISMGWKADFAKGEYNRKKDVTRYSLPRRDNSVVCQDGDISCVNGEQYAGWKNIAKKRHIKVDNNHYSLYFEDNMKFKQFEITPGIRIDYDEYLGNIDVAPRFTASYDVFNDEKTKIFGGVNRYYADSMLRHALSDQLRNQEKYTRKVGGSYTYIPWDDVDGKETFSDRSFGGNVKTPYSDEFNVGIRQRIKNTEWTAKWVHRKSDDQFSTRNERKKLKNQRKKINFAYLENNGGGKSDSLTLTGRLMEPFETKYTTISWDLGASYSKSTSNFNDDNTIDADYDESMSPENDSSEIIFDGKVINKKDMPALNFSTPWKVFANVNFDFPQWHLNWNNRLGYTAGYDSYNTGMCNSSYNMPEVCNELGYAGEKIEAYEKTSFPKRFTLDWHFSYKPPVPGGNFELSLDVLNVLDKTVESSLPFNHYSRKVGYKSGRQFWLGAKYIW
ncbi:MAG: TonB-dependent receptor [Gammaproteobacteria bacterium]|nr:TonB-dependent receptor [Gammaproteobacteria bacterium]